jgi:Uma2 family endonuclease
MTVMTWNMPAVDGLTVDDIEDMPENLRVELHNGDLVVKVPGTLWHEKIAEAIVILFASQRRFAATNPGIKRTARDTRVPDVGVFFTEPTDWDTAYHNASELEVVVEVWSKSSDEKDHQEMQWYADRGTPEYWLVTPIEGKKLDVQISQFKLTIIDGRPAYRHEATTTLGELTGTA